MPSASTPESGQRLARDMRRVRESRDITVGDLHDETKIPEGLIEAFEDKALFDHPQFNRVYLRSFVRTYANVIGIDADVALAALEEALSDRYTGLLAVEYLGEAPGESGTIPRIAKAPGAPRNDASSIAEETREAERERVTPRRHADADPASADESENGVHRLESTSKTYSAESEPGSGYHAESEPETYYDQERGSEVSKDVDEWSVASPPPPAAPPGRSSGRAELSSGSGAPLPAREIASSREARRSRERRPDRRWIGAVGAALLVVAAIVWVVVSVTNEGETVGQETTAVVGNAEDADTVSLGRETSPAQSMPAVGDTINVIIIAAVDKLEPIRVTVDDDLRRPYWLEHGDSMAFVPTSRIVVEGQLDDAELAIEGIDYPTDRRDDLGRIVITRDSVVAYFSTSEGP